MKKLLTKFLCLGTLLIMFAGILCACNKDDNFRNPRNGEPEAGKFYSLQTAYDNGWICKDDLRNISYHSTGDAQKKGFVPTPKNPETLNAETERAMKEAFIIAFPDNEINSTVDDVRLDGYYGVYDGFVAVMLECTYLGHMEVVTNQNIGGVQFAYNNSNTMWLWKAC